MPDNLTVGGFDFVHNWLNRKYNFSMEAFYSRLNGSTTAISKLQKSAVHLYQREDANHLSFNPDFDYQEFNSNFVLRWEYKTGSSFYFVWTNSISNYTNEYNPSIIESLKNIGKGTSQNAFMVKLSYWFSL